MTTTLLSVKALSRSFGGLTAVDAVDFEVREGEVVGLIGPNGAGKTTTFNLIAGAITPSSGLIVYDGRPIAGAREDMLAKLGIIRTFQITSVFSKLTVLENVICGAHRTYETNFWHAVTDWRKYRRTEADLTEAAHAVLSRLKLDHLSDMVADELSYGDLRKLEIAIALAAKPRLLLLDEPAAGLIPEERSKLIALLGSIRAMGTTILLVEHSMQVVMAACDRIVVLNTGKKIAEGTPREIATSNTVIEVYLGKEFKRAQGA
jgi:branched-chain amino acid transport system ATP-binding protein